MNQHISFIFQLGLTGWLFAVVFLGAGLVSSRLGWLKAERWATGVTVGLLILSAPLILGGLLMMIWSMP